jgi:hypothetical protein
MRINRFLDVYAGVVMEDVAEGRFCLQVPSGSDEPIMGVRLPTTSDEASDAELCVAWPPTNQEPPYYTDIPSYSWALRQGFDRDANAPFNTDVSYVYPGFRDSSTIPSGTRVRLFPVHSVVTLTSGNFVESASWAEGAPVGIAYSGADAGKPQYDASGTVATVVEYDASALELTIRIR